MHKHLNHGMQFISINVISLLVLSNGGHSQNGANENPMTIDKKMDKELNK